MITPRRPIQRSPSVLDVALGFQQVAHLVSQLNQIKEDHAKALAEAQQAHKDSLIELKSKLSTEGKKTLDTSVQQLIDKTSTQFRALFSDLQKKTEEVIALAHQTKRIQKGDPGEPGQPGHTPQVGVDFFTEKEKKALIKEIATLITPPKDGKPGKDAILTGDTLHNLLNQKPLSTKHVDGLEQTLSVIRNLAARGGVRGGGDTVKAGSGISLTRNSDGTITLTNTGTSATKVRDEAPSGSGTSFTLTHTPASNTLQLFRGGTRQQAGAGNDYTLSGTTITLAVALQAGEILLADYEY